MKKLILAVFCLISSVLAFAGDGTKENPYTCAEAIALQQKSSYREALLWVKGFIVGVPFQGDKGEIGYRNEAVEEQKKQFALADDIYGTNWMPVRLNDDERLEIYNLSVYLHPEIIGTKVLIRTVPQPFYGLPGAKNSLEYEILPPIPVTSISLNKTEETLFVNQTLELKSTILPADADNKRIFWSSSNPTVAAVDNNGVVTAQMNGEATITAKTADGNKTATCKITVTTASGEILMGDIITADTTGVLENQYTVWSGRKCNSGTIYAGKSATENAAIKIRTKNATSEKDKQTGIVNTTSVGYLRQVIVEWDSQTQTGRKINVLGSNEAVSSTAALFANLNAFESLGILEHNTTTKMLDTLNITQNIGYVGIVSESSNALYIKKISLVWAINKTAEDVVLQSLALSETQLELETECTHQLTAIFNPTNATYKAVDWSSSNTAVATVEVGKVTAVGAGEADITVKSRVNPSISATCHVVVTKKDPFAGREIYYKITDISQLHNNDSIVLVNEATARVSANFETYETKEKDDLGVLQTIICGRIRASETELVREDDKIGSWGAEEIRLVAAEGGKWRIFAGVWTLNKITNELDREEVELRATEKNKLQTAGEGTKTWTIDIVGGNAKIVSTNASVGSLQFNSNNKTFSTYKSEQNPVQIYRKKNQVTDALPEVKALENLLFVDGIVYNENNLQLRVYNIAGQLVTSGAGNLDLRSCQRGVYLICSPNAILKVVR